MLKILVIYIKKLKDGVFHTAVSYKKKKKTEKNLKGFKRIVSVWPF